jgi:hypothetical protein
MCWWLPVRKERGFFSTYYTYITVFISNAANLKMDCDRGVRFNVHHTYLKMDRQIEKKLLIKKLKLYYYLPLEKRALF